MTDTPSSREHPRRAVAKAAAWSVPTIALTAAAPALAASGTPACSTTYAFTVSGKTATWTNTSSSPVTLTYVTSVPLGSVWNTMAGYSMTSGEALFLAYSPPAGISRTYSDGGSFTSAPATSTSTSLTWTATLVAQPGAKFQLSTQAGNCKATAPQATVQVTSPVVDCPFGYPIDCPT